MDSRLIDERHILLSSLLAERTVKQLFLSSIGPSGLYCCLSFLFVSLLATSACCSSLSFFSFLSLEVDSCELRRDGKVEGAHLLFVSVQCSGFSSSLALEWIQRMKEKEKKEKEEKEEKADLLHGSDVTKADPIEAENSLPTRHQTGKHNTTREHIRPEERKAMPSSSSSIQQKTP